MIEYKKHDNFNDIVHIMVRIRGFGYALGRAIGEKLSFGGECCAYS